MASIAWCARIRNCERTLTYDRHADLADLDGAERSQEWLESTGVCILKVRTKFMCGIAGVFVREGVPDLNSVNRMLSSMAHRGPDDSGIQIVADGRLALGHLRLSILDLSPLGHQPMSSRDGRDWIVYNGEIYNFREIRSTLEADGESFVSDSDTEVILAAFRRWGLRCVDRFRGMFAFALWDDANKVLHLCRDRFGVKPLYFSLNERRLAFASEMKGLICGDETRRDVEPSALAQFVQFGYISAPRSIFSDVKTLRPGTICSIDMQMRVSELEYWSPGGLFDGRHAHELRRELAGLPDPEVLDRIERSLAESFAYRMVADVPVGVFLSGGIDSSLLATLLTRKAGFALKTFTISFPDSEFDESSYARAVAETLGADHTEFSVSRNAILNTATEIVEIADEPIGDSSLMPTLLVSRLARQHVKVALSADGADELFGGYARYAVCGNFVEKAGATRALYFLSAEILDALPPGIVARAYELSRRGGPKFAAINDKLRKFVRMAKSSSEFAAYEATTSEWTASQARAFLVNPGPQSDCAQIAYQRVRGDGPRDRFMHFDMTQYLPGDLLVKVDRASMAVSLEAREPFLDHEMAKLAAALPVSWKIREGENKYILRELLYKYFPRTLFDRPKQGFSAPIADWLRGPLRPVVLERLSTAALLKEGLLDPSVVEPAVQRFLRQDSRSGSAAGVWMLLQLQMWSARWRRLAARPAALVALRPMLVR